jgi:hypothetical protein
MKKYLITLLVVFTVNSFAAATIPTGKCGGVFQMHRKLFISKEYDGKGVDSMVHLDFDNMTFSMQTNQITLPSNYPSGEPKYVFTGAKSAPMNVSVGLLPNSFKVEVPSGGIILYLMSVNSGNSFLIQGHNDHVSGVCQKI